MNSQVYLDAFNLFGLFQQEYNKLLGTENVDTKILFKHLNIIKTELSSKEETEMNISLYLAESGLGQQGIQALANVLERCQDFLSKLSLRGNQLQIDTIPHLVRGFSANKNLKELDLSHNSSLFSEKEDGISKILRALATSPSLETLYLENCWVGDKPLQAVSYFLQTSTSIQLLDIRKNKITKVGLATAAVNIRKNKTLSEFFFEPQTIPLTTKRSKKKNPSLPPSPFSKDPSLLAIQNVTKRNSEISLIWKDLVDKCVYRRRFHNKKIVYQKSLRHQPAHLHQRGLQQALDTDESNTETPDNGTTSTTSTSSAPSTPTKSISSMSASQSTPIRDHGAFRQPGSSLKSTPISNSLHTPGKRSFATGSASYRTQLGSASPFLPDVNLMRSIRNHIQNINTDPPQHASSRRFRVGWADTIGRRPDMEDATIIQGRFRRNDREDLFGVFDGHGGSAPSKFCANTLPSRICTLIDKAIESKGMNLEEFVPFTEADTFKVRAPKASQLSDDEITKIFEQAFEDQNESMKEWAIFMGTTALVALVADDRIHIANLGDTRAVLCKNRKALRLSRDHKPSDQSEQERILKEGGEVKDDRVNGQLGVSRSLGDTQFGPCVTFLPECCHFQLRSDFEFIIIACDGVWDVFDDQQAVNIVANEIDPSRAARILVEKAYEKGSDDNISAIVVFLK